MKPWIPAALAAALCAATPACALQQIVVTEPLHSVGYLPLYVAIHEGFFKDEGLEVKVTTVDSGSGHTNAVLSGQAFAFIGGPEHDAYAKAKGGELRTVVNIVDRGNVYLVAGKKGMPANGDVAGFVKGKRIVTSLYGGTPNSITRYLLDKWQLDAKKDLTVTETSNSAVFAAVKAGQADIGVTTEPYVTRGVKEGLWSEPFYNVPKELGPYAYSTINVRLDSIQKDPKTVAGVVRAIVRGLKFTYDKPDAAAAIAKQEFPTMDTEDLKATIDRSYKDEIWSHDGTVSRAAWDTAKAVVTDAGLLKQDVPYDAIIDMQFVQRLDAAGK